MYNSNWSLSGPRRKTPARWLLPLVVAGVVAGVGTLAARRWTHGHHARTHAPIRAVAVRLVKPAHRMPKWNGVGLPPNELGRVMVLMYHRLGDKNTPLMRTPQSFRHDLELLYQHGYRPVPMKDFLDSRIHLPMGLSPVVLTFDDALPTQFHEISKNGRYFIDPNCTVGILESFHQQHPDFALAGVFYALYPHPFGDADRSAAKITFLTRQGFEIGNHTVHHKDLSRMSNAQVIEEVGRAQVFTQRILPGYQDQTLAAPYGRLPRDHAIALNGVWHGVPYHNRAVFLGGGGPAHSPCSKKWKAWSVPRVVGDPGELAKWVNYFDQHPDQRYVSDGDPDVITVPSSEQSDLNRKALAGRLVNVRDDGPEVALQMPQTLSDAARAPKRLPSKG